MLLFWLNVYFILPRAGTLKKFQEMTGDSGNSITRILFCGPHFPASHNYTIEYLQHHPFVKVFSFILLLDMLEL